MVGIKPVPDLSAEAKVVERVGVRPGVGVETHRIARIAHQFIQLLVGETERIVHSHATRRVRQVQLEGRIADRLPTRHAEKVLDGEVVHLAARDPAERSEPGRVGHHVESPDLVIRAPRTFAATSWALALPLKAFIGTTKLIAVTKAHAASNVLDDVAMDSSFSSRGGGQTRPRTALLG